MQNKLMIMMMALILLTSSGNLYYALTAKPSVKETEIIREIRTMAPYLQRMEINEMIQRNINDKKVDALLEIYKDVADEETVYLILNYAILYDIPVSLLFAIVDVESGFKTNAYNKNRNGTIDRGLMSLNSKTFSRYSKEQLYEPKTNLRLGCEHLVYLKEKYETWGGAIIHYNGLYTKGAGFYLVNVLEKERYYERLFNENQKNDKMQKLWDDSR